VSDFLALDTCFVGMDDVQVWLLEKLYGPDCFGYPRRTVAGISEAARSQFPELRLTTRMLSRRKNEALQRVEEQCKRENLM
jgi:hypothetical protein